MAEKWIKLQLTNGFLLGGCVLLENFFMCDKSEMLQISSSLSAAVDNHRPVPIVRTSTCTHRQDGGELPR